ncbi:MAG: hypothetical protein JSU06_19510 [Actinobacteria bacterium]|nr:hypothetical protein [Actinomycetota bacterium]
MNFNEAAVFKWVLIVGAAGASVIGLTLLTRPLVGALWGLVLVIAGCVYGYRWTREWWRNAKDRPDGPGGSA